MGWNEVGMGGGNGLTKDDFIRLTNGQKVKVHILLEDGEEPKSYFSAYIGPEEAKRTVIIGPENEDHEAISSADKRAKHAMNVYVYEAKAVKILELGNRAMEQVKTIWENYDKSLDSVDLVISRKGAGLKTEYLVTPTPSQFSKVDVSGLTKYDLDDALKPSTVEYIDKVVNGESFNPEAVEASASEGAEATAETVEELPEVEPFPGVETEEAPAEEEMAPEPKPGRIPLKKPVAQGKTAVLDRPKAAAPDRSALISQVLKAFTAPKYAKNPALKAQLLLKVTKSKESPKGKQTVSQCAITELQTLLKLAK